MADDMNNLDQGLGDYYRSRCLGPDRIAAIEASVLRTRRIERVARRSALAVAVSVAIIAAVWLRPESGADRTRQIVAEIARNKPTACARRARPPRRDSCRRRPREPFRF